MAFLKAYKSDEGYIGKIDASEITFKSSADVRFIVILDQSGSMGDSVQIFVNFILPRILVKLEMTSVDIHLITFSNSSEIYTGNMTFFENLYIYEQGSTYMKHAIKNLELLLKQLIVPNHKQNIRILTISDGEIFDQPETLNHASRLFLNIKEHFMINSQAVRFFTSSDEPDTRALSSILQFNTLSSPQLIDINADGDFEEIAESIANLYRYDGMNFKVTLKSPEKIFKESPWNPSENSIDLYEGENVIWMDKLPEQVYIRSEIEGTEFDCDIPVQVCERLTVNNYKTILDKKIEFFMKKLKVLKVVNTPNSLNEMKTIIQYFEKFEQFLNSNTDHLSDIEYIHIKDRVRLLKKNIQKRDLSITNKMKEIQNNDRVNQLNSKQLADFLRNVDTNKDGKSLSRRGIAEGLDFDVEARKEVLAMAEHLDEIKDIDDSKHFISFYSTATTLEGIKSVCELAEDQDVLAETSAIDIIKLLNIVGIGCDAYIGNYTDPMIYRLKDIYLGCYVSLSDVLTASEFSGGRNNLVDYNTRRTIVNVIPVFEDQRIQQFLLKYAPKLLEYTASIGMRRVLVEVPYTYEFTIESGILKLCQMLNTSRTEAGINLFRFLLETYQVASKGHYSYVNGLITKQMERYNKDPEQSKNYIYLDDNSAACMTNVFINIIINGQMEILPKVLRHLFCHEVHKAVNKLIKNNQTVENYIHNTLKSLLGVDFEKNGTSLPELFDPNPVLKFSEVYTVNYQVVEEIFKHANNAMDIPFIPYYIQAAMQDNKLEAFNNLREYNEENVKHLFGIDYDFELFKAFSIVQAFLCRKNETRIDTETQSMKIIDIDNYSEADRMVRNYVIKRYKEEFEQRFTAQLKMEVDILEDELVLKMLSSKTIKEFKDGFQNGLTRGNTSVSIKNTNSPAFLKLKNELESNYRTANYPLLFDKVYIILFGRDANDQDIWNNGNVCRKFNGLLKTILKETNPERWNVVYEIYRKRNIHIYRSGFCNRHGHSNDKPSYSALGYKSLEEMFASVSQEEIDEYKSIHIGCCGL